MKLTGIKPLSAIVSAFAAAVLAASLLPASALAAPSTSSDGSGWTVAKTADPDTSSTWEDLFGAEDSNEESSFSTEEAGRIWTDKSVYDTAEAAQEAGVPNATIDGDYDFLVALSAYGSAASVRQEQTVPHDVVFVVSLNSTTGSLSYNGKTYAEHLVDGLNAAIKRLMAENSDGIGPDDPTRVAVVGYSIDATVLLPLDTYEPDEHGNYVTFSRSLSGGAGIEVVATPSSSTTTVSDGVLRGSAYLQRGIAVARDILCAAGEATTADSPRAPELVVMASNVAPAANTDIAEPPAYVGEAQGQHGFLGSLPVGHETGYGTDAALATLLTLQDSAQRIDKAYAASGETLHLYTVGLDTSDLAAYVLQTAEGQASMNVTGTGDAADINLVENIEKAREQYADAAARNEESVDLSLYSAGKSDLVSKTIAFPRPIDELLIASDGYAFYGADKYLLATDAGALPDAFGAAVDYMLDIEYTSPVSATELGTHTSTDRLRMEDDLGQFMQVKRIDGIEFNGTLLDGSLAAAAVVQSFNDPWDNEAYHEVHHLVLSLQERYDLEYWDAYNLLYYAFCDGQIAYENESDYSNSVAWYVDADHKMVPSDGQGYTFASASEINAVQTGDWAAAADDATKGKIAVAERSGATALCQTYFYIGNLENQYTGADVPLYDMVVMVETSLATGDQRVLFSAPADSLPASKAYVTEFADGTATMTLDEDAATSQPMRLVYEVGPRDDVEVLIGRITAGEDTSAADIEAVFGENATDDSGAIKLVTNATADADGTIEAQAVMTTVTAGTDGYYSFLRDTPLYELAPGQTAPADGHPTEDQLEPLTTAPDKEKTYYYRATYYTATSLEPGVPSSATRITTFEPYTVTADDTPTHFGTTDDGQVFARASTPKFDVSAMLANYTKDPNDTGTATYSKQIAVSDYADTGRAYLSARLGNNGAITIAPPVKAGTLSITKAVTGEGADHEHEWQFSVTLTNADDSPLDGTFECAFARADGTTRAEQARFDTNGSYMFALGDGETITIDGIPADAKYSIKETDPDLENESYTVYAGTERDIAQSGNAEYRGTMDPATTMPVYFVNVKTGFEPIAVTIGGDKTLLGRDQIAGEFVFELLDEDENPINDANGNPIVATTADGAAEGVASPFTFPGISVDEPGTYTYLVHEQQNAGSSAGSNINYDSRMFTVVIDVRVDDDGALFVASTTYAVDSASANGISFVNEMPALKGTFEITARKTLERDGVPDESLAADAFAFALQEIDPATEEPIGTPRLARNDVEGTVNFGGFAAEAPAGETVARSFIVSESVPPEALENADHEADGIVYDTRQYRVDVVGADGDGDGTLTFERTVSVRTASDGQWSELAMGDISFENAIAAEEPTEPDNPGGTTDPDYSDNPDKPTDPEDPDDPGGTDPDDPNTPTDPDDPADPGNPSDPSSGTDDPSTQNPDSIKENGSGLAQTGDLAAPVVIGITAVLVVAIGIALSAAVCKR